ncbi:MAG: response regulator [Prevotella sp.]|nr:response regulator [Prevotella sp.]
MTLTAICCLSLAGSHAATTGSTNCRRITMDDGLPSNTVRNIVQDRFGFLWFGTDNGLCRYDGTQVQTFRIAELETSQYVSALTSTDEGLYIGTERGVYFYDFAQQHISRLPMTISTAVTSLTVDRDGQLWVGTLGQGAWRHDARSGRSKHYAFSEIRGNVNCLFVDRDNRVWALTNWGDPAVQRLNKVSDAFEPVSLRYDGPYQSLCMLQTGDGTLWLGSWEEGLLRIADDGRLEAVLSPETDRVGHHIHTLYELSADCIAIGCDDGPLSLNTRTGEWHRLLPADGGTPHSERFAYAFRQDREGGLWIGTFYGGVNYLSPVAGRFEPVRAGVIGRFCEDRQGRVWVASDDGGLSCYVAAERRFAPFAHQQELSRLNVHALCIDGDDLWIGTYTDGVYVLNTTTGRLRHYGPTGHDRGLNDYSSYAIMRDHEGTVWVATINALLRYDAAADRFRMVRQIGALTIDIDEDRQGRLWLSTQGGGLWRYTPRTGQWQHYQHQAGQDDGLPDTQVNGTLVDAEGRLWVATQDGLLQWDEASASFTLVHMDIPSQAVMCVVEGQDGLWLSTDRGIVKYVAGDGILRFTRQDGLVSEQFQPNAGLMTADGRIFFGSTSGFNTFYPHTIKTNSVMAPVYITSLEILNREEKTPDGLPLSVGQQRELRMAYGDGKMFSLSFAALSYCSPDKNQYAYRLDGFDKEWNYVGNQHKATYTNIPPGTYTFRVKATNNDGIWTPDEATLRIVVRPPFWWTWWARALYLLLAVAALWWFVRSRLKRTERRHQHELQRLSEAKEREVREARLNFFTMIAHEIRTPVSLIIGPLEKLKGRLTDESMAGQFDIIDRNAHRLLELVGQLLDFRKVEQQSLVMHMAPHNIYDLVRAVSDRFAPTFEQGGKHFEVSLPDRRFTAFVDHEGLTKVVSNLLTNANKYTRDDVRLACSVEPDGDHFRIVVADNGVGIREADRERIFEPFFQAQDNKPGTGIGLSIVKNIVDQHHGTISVSSEPGQGSTFTVVLPVEQAIDNATEPQPSTLTPPPSSLPTMLIVDDSDDMLSFLAGNFQSTYNVLTAADGIEALDVLSRQGADVQLIISDWMMPRMDGAELCRRVRQDPSTSHISFIMLTAKTDHMSRVESMEVGADVYIEKPFSVEFLEGCIRNMLDMRQRLLKRFTSKPDVPVTQIASNPTDNEFLERMNRIIEANFANPDLNVNFLAEEMAISRSGLFAKIKTLADMTPNEMIQVVRLKRAYALLSEGRYLVNEVCYKVGFNNPSYFTKCFQKQFGIRPSEV